MIEVGGREYLTVKESAERIGVSYGRVFHFLADGRLTAICVLGRRLLEKEEVDVFRSNRQTKPGRNPR